MSSRSSARLVPIQPPQVHSSWNGLLPLHQAARYGQVEIFRYLLDECGADPAQREGALANSVLHTAAWYKQPAIVEYILR
jgi:ankyrin repeat protein